MRKHTLGPWQVKPLEKNKIITVYIQACNDRAEWIARMEWTNEADTAYANAHLIAASPELLAFSKVVRDACTYQSDLNTLRAELKILAQKLIDTAEK